MIRIKLDSLIIAKENIIKFKCKIYQSNASLNFPKYSNVIPFNVHILKILGLSLIA